MKGLLTCFVFVFLFSSCHKNGCLGASRAKVVDKTGFDGCGKLLKLADGELLEPNNLVDFEELNLKDGDKVWINYHDDPSPSICMMGKTVKIDCLSKR